MERRHGGAEHTIYVVSLIEDLNDGDLKLEDIVLLEVAECRMINDALETEQDETPHRG